MEPQGVLNAVFQTGIVGNRTYRPRLKLTILNPVQAPPAGNTRRQEENGIWNAVFNSSNNSIRVSVV